MPLLNRPRWQGNVRLLWQPRDRVDVTGSVRFNGSFLDSSVPTGILAIGGHAEADVGVSWRVARRLTLGAVVRNITDDRSKIVVGYPQVGRRGLLTLDVQGL